MVQITSNYKKILDKIPSHVKLVAISKNKTVDEVLQLYNAGQQIFGESKAQELQPKYEKLPDDIKWHMVGHLQRNKVKYIVPFVNMIESVDSLKLLQEIDKEATKNNRVIKCLLQMHIAEEETKFGLSMEEISEILDSNDFKQMENVSVMGLMGMATFTENEDQVRKEFKTLKSTFDKLKDKYFKSNDTFSEISMGMSNDYHLGIEEGSTMVRIGTALFGGR